jgi:nucleotide-binding universal stress UspA family protein
MSERAMQIVIPVDFKEQSLIALRQSYNLARLTNSEITLLYVLDEDIIKPLQDIDDSKSDYEDYLRAGIGLRLTELATKVHGESGIKVNTMIRTGKIYEQIVEAARELDATLIVMGTMGAVGLKKRILGSNASRVVREASCPVITIKGKQHRPGIRHILLPLDLTKETKEKVDKAIELSLIFGSVIHIVSIIESNDEYLMNKLTRQMDQVQEFVQLAGISCTTEFVSGSHVADEILNTAKKVEADLIMIMTQQEVGFTHLFISSAAQEIINDSDIPVLSIRPFPKKVTTASILS